MSYLNPDILADNFSLWQWLQEKTINQHADINYNDIRGKEHFTSKVVSDGPSGDLSSYTGRNFWAKARPIGTMHDYCTPDPCSNDSYTALQRKLIISLHPTMCSTRPLSQHHRPPNFGDSLKMHFYGEGPNASSAKMRDPRFEHQSSLERVRYGCAFKQIESVAGSFGSGAKTTLGKKRKKTPPKETKDAVLLFGDSQMQNTDAKGGKTIGKTLQGRYKNALPTHGNHSWTAETWLYGKKNGKDYDAKKHPTEKAKLEKNLKQKPSKIIIGLGGNGVSKNAKYEKELLTWVKKLAPSASITWIGPPPPASDGLSYNKDGSHLAPRKVKNETLEKHIGPLVDKFVNSYKIPGYENGYSCSKKCDGIHMAGKWAEDFIEKAGL